MTPYRENTAPAPPIGATWSTRRRPSSLCQLARDWMGEIPEGGAMVERKHDGWRALWFKGQLWTRNGMPYRGIGHIVPVLQAIEREFGCPMFLDGEFVVGEGVNTLAQTKAHQERGWRGGDAGRLWLFDAMPLAAWEGDCCPTPLYARKQALTDAVGAMKAHPLSWEYSWWESGDCPVAVVPDQWAFDMADAETMAREVWSAGGEGVVIKDPMSAYRRNRNSAWCKYRRDIERRIAA